MNKYDIKGQWELKMMSYIKTCRSTMMFFGGNHGHGENSVKKTAEASVALLGAEQSPARFP